MYHILGIINQGKSQFLLLILRIFIEHSEPLLLGEALYFIFSSNFAHAALSTTAPPSFFFPSKGLQETGPLCWEGEQTGQVARSPAALSAGPPRGTGPAIAAHHPDRPGSFITFGALQNAPSAGRPHRRRCFQAGLREPPLGAHGSAAQPRNLRGPRREEEGAGRADAAAAAPSGGAALRLIGANEESAAPGWAGPAPSRSPQTPRWDGGAPGRGLRVKQQHPDANGIGRVVFLAGLERAA